MNGILHSWTADCFQVFQIYISVAVWFGLGNNAWNGFRRRWWSGLKWEVNYLFCDGRLNDLQLGLGLGVSTALAVTCLHSKRPVWSPLAVDHTTSALNTFNITKTPLKTQVSALVKYTLHFVSGAILQFTFNQVYFTDHLSVLLQ